MKHHSLMSSIELSWTKAGGNHGTSRKKNSKEYGLQSLKRGTLPQGPRLPRSEAQCLDMSTRLLPTPSLQGKPLDNQ
ncbi:unnamed protein product [Microthlaspi erraticum]|uniref:Uncharacterized protein n=1 Tax=Microthlaspi erraticum TaxID=1685480 RepID=A0A6D2L3W4_9BRAS|nr:unnamed protein product [Microthlaspi erraticum]